MLEILNLTFKEKGKELSVLEDISFTLDEGEFLVWLDPLALENPPYCES